MVEFLRKFENRGINIVLFDLIRLAPPNQSIALIVYGVGLRCDVDIFKLTARAQSINREVWASIIWIVTSLYRYSFLSILIFYPLARALLISVIIIIIKMLIIMTVHNDNSNQHDMTRLPSSIKLGVHMFQSDYTRDTICPQPIVNVLEHYRCTL